MRSVVWGGRGVYSITSVRDLDVNGSIFELSTRLILPSHEDRFGPVFSSSCLHEACVTCNALLCCIELELGWLRCMCDHRQ